MARETTPAHVVAARVLPAQRFRIQRRYDELICKHESSRTDLESDFVAVCDLLESGIDRGMDYNPNVDS